jgi:hypothetical protein
VTGLDEPRARLDTEIAVDERRKKDMKTEWRHQQRAAALAALPLPLDELEAMFDMLDVELTRQGCDHSRRLTRRWLETRGHDIDVVFAWLDTQGGFCDCEVLDNVEESVDEAKRALPTDT